MYTAAVLVDPNEVVIKFHWYIFGNSIYSHDTVGDTKKFTLCFFILMIVMSQTHTLVVTKTIVLYEILSYNYAKEVCHSKCLHSVTTVPIHNYKHFLKT